MANYSEPIQGVTLRPAVPADVPAILGLMDIATHWLVDQGRTGQWGDGSSPHSENAARIKQANELVDSGGGWVAVGPVPPPPLPSQSGEDPSAAEDTPAKEAEDQVIGAVIVMRDPVPYVKPAAEPERYVRMLITHRAWQGRRLGTLLIGKAREITKAAGVELLRVDCYAGGGGKLVKWYESQGFAKTESMEVGGTWPAQVLEMRV